MKRVAIIAAMPGELQPFLEGAAEKLPNSDPTIQARRRPVGEAEVIAVWAGAGLAAAKRAFLAAEAVGPLSAVVSTGWAGALSAEYFAGRAYTVSLVVDAQTGEAFPTAAVPDRWGGLPPTRLPEVLHGSLATSHQVANSADKARLAASLHADLVDMEAVAVARLAAARGIPFYCIKGISDGLTDHFPNLNPFLTASGQFKLLRFILFAAVRPWWWRPLAQLGRQSKSSARHLAVLLHELLSGLN